MNPRRVAFALAAHPDDIEFMMAGTLVLLGDAGYEIHYMNVANGSYYGLDPVGSRIWALIAEGRLVSELCALLLEEFEVEPGQCEHHVLTFLNKLAQNNLVTVVDESAA